jgi:hypothetical protein
MTAFSRGVAGQSIESRQVEVGPKLTLQFITIHNATNHRYDA